MSADATGSVSLSPSFIDAGLEEFGKLQIVGYVTVDDEQGDTDITYAYELGPDNLGAVVAGSTMGIVLTGSSAERHEQAMMTTSS